MEAVKQLSLADQFQLLTDLQCQLLPPVEEPSYVVYNVGAQSAENLFKPKVLDIMYREMANRETKSALLYFNTEDASRFDTHRADPESDTPFQVHPEAHDVYAALTTAGIQVEGLVVKHAGSDSVQALIPIIMACPGFSLMGDLPTYLDICHVMIEGVIKMILILYFDA